jgi:hypothetical protein
LGSKYIEGSSKVSPEVFQTVLLDEIAERLLHLEELLAKPRGCVYPIRVAVEKLTIIDFVRGYPYTRLFAITLFNDGPDSVYPSVNDYQKHTPLNTGESLTLEYHSPRIEKLILDVDEGKTANVRGFGIY